MQSKTKTTNDESDSPTGVSAGHPRLLQAAAALRNGDVPNPRLLVLDTSYCLEAIRARGLEDSVTCRDLGGFFDRVWTVHPFASLVSSTEWGKRYGTPDWYPLNPKHTFGEGKIGRFAALSSLPFLNFVLSQIDLAWRLTRLIRRQRIGVIRAGNPLYLGLFAWMLARLTGIPFLVRVGSNNDKIYQATRTPMMPRLFRWRWVEKRVERFVFRRADFVVGANEDNLKFALANGARPEAASVFRYGNLIDKRHFVPPTERVHGQDILEELGLSDSAILLYVGRLEAVKHPDHVLRVLARVRDKGHSARAVLVGDGRLRSQLESLATELGIHNHVVFCGNMNQEWLAEVIPLATAVISPHTGRALGEAALGGAPIVAYDIDWQKELILSGETGELVPYLAWEEMASSVERFITEPTYAKQLGSAARRRALDMLDPETLDRHERATYRRLLARAGRVKPEPFGAQNTVLL